MALKSGWTLLFDSWSMDSPGVGTWGRGGGRHCLELLGTKKALLSVQFAAGAGLPLLFSESFSVWGCRAIASFLVLFHFLLGIGSAALQLQESTQNNQETK